MSSREMLRVVITVVGSALLVALAVASSLLALIFTGGDSFFADRSAWVYAPWLVALGLTLPACAATLVLAEAPAAALIGTAMVAYAATFALWLVVLPQQG